MAALRRAAPDDIAFILATERRPGYDALVGRFEEDVHRANLGDDNWMYFIGLDDAGAPQGFAILQDVNADPDSRFLRRIAVADAGRGFGRPFLAALIDWVFANTAATRFRLHVRTTNTRAQHVYRSLGFVANDEAREADEGSLVLLKRDWRRDPG